MTKSLVFPCSLENTSEIKLNLIFVDVKDSEIFPDGYFRTYHYARNALILDCFTKVLITAYHSRGLTEHFIIILQSAGHNCDNE